MNRTHMHETKHFMHLPEKTNLATADNIIKTRGYEHVN